MAKAVIGKCKGCGNIVTAALDLEYPEIGQDILQWLRDDLSIDYMDSPITVHGCTCKETPNLNS